GLLCRRRLTSVAGTDRPSPGHHAQGRATGGPMPKYLLCALVAGALLATLPAPPLVAAGQQAPPAAASTVTDLNTATLAQLESLPGIGRSTAERIIEHRKKIGGFKKIEELMNVKGIGEKSFLRLKPLVAVAPKTEKAGGGQ